MALVGQRVDLSYPYEHLGEGGAALAKLLKGGPALDMLKSAERPAVIVGPGILSRGDRGAVLQQARAQPGCLSLRMPGWLCCVHAPVLSRRGALHARSTRSLCQRASGDRLTLRCARARSMSW